MKVYFEKSDSTFLQGIAILLMVLLHLFAFPERVPEYVSVVNLIDKQGQLLTTIATFGHICVSIFVFVSGYGMQFSEMYTNDSFVNKVDKSFKRGLLFWGRYALQFIIFVPMGVLLGKLYNISVSQLLKAFMGQECGTINGEWWYVTLYLKFLIVFPFISLGIEKIKIVSFKIVYFFVVGVISTKVLGSYGLLFVVGIMCANFNLINRLSCYFSREKIGKYAPLILIAVGGGRYYMMLSMGHLVYRYDVIFLPIICTCIAMCKKTNTIYRVIVFLGKYSMYMWLTHTFYIYYYFQNTIFAFKYASLIYAVTIFLSLTTAILIERLFDSKIIKLVYNRIFAMEDICLNCIRALGKRG